MIGASLSEPHCSVVNDEISVYIFAYIYGGQLSVYYSLMSNYSNKLRKIQMYLRNCAIIHVDSKIKLLKLSEGKDAFNDEGSSIESVEIEKRLTREREDFLGGDRGTQFVDNRVSELC